MHRLWPHAAIAAVFVSGGRLTEVCQTKSLSDEEDRWRCLTVGGSGEVTEVTVVHTLWLLPSVSVEAGRRRFVLEVADGDGDDEGLDTGVNGSDGVGDTLVAWRYCCVCQWRQGDGGD